MGDAWLAERVASIRDEATTAHAREITWAAVALLWPEALRAGRAQVDATDTSYEYDRQVAPEAR